MNITNSPGYDNQPFFTPDGAQRAVHVGRGAAGTTQTDIYRYDIAAKRTISAGDQDAGERVLADGDAGGAHFGDPRRARRAEHAAAVAVHRWTAAIRRSCSRTSSRSAITRGPTISTLALFVLGQPRRRCNWRIHATGTGSHGRVRYRTIDPADSRNAAPSARSASCSASGAARRVRLMIKKLNPATGEVSLLTPAVEGSTEADTAWTPDGTLLMVKGTCCTAGSAARPDGRKSRRSNG